MFDVAESIGLPASTGGKGAAASDAGQGPPNFGNGLVMVFEEHSARNHFF